MSGANLGHGHVTPRPDGHRARCGGPGLCRECSREQALKDANQRTLAIEKAKRDAVSGLTRLPGENRKMQRERLRRQRRGRSRAER